MSLYSEFLDDAKEMIADFGVAGSANSGSRLKLEDCSEEVGMAAV